MNGATQVDADGLPPVTHRARMMVREASGRASVNLGGIAEAEAFVPCRDRSFFCFSNQGRLADGPSINHPNTLQSTGAENTGDEKLEELP